MATKRSIKVTVDADLLDAVHRWAVCEGFEDAATAAKTLIRMSLSATPGIGAMEGARLQAYNETSKWLMKRIRSALGEIRTQLELSEPEEPQYKTGGPDAY